MKKILLLTLLAGLLSYCTSDPKPTAAIVGDTQPTPVTQSTPNTPAIPNIKTSESPEELQRKIRNLQPTNNTPTEPFEVKKVNLSQDLSPVMIAKGKKTFETNCASCHSLTKTKGPKASGLAAVLDKRTPAWFMNMTTAVPIKLGKNNREENQLKKCPTRNYDTRMSFVDSRDFLELLLSLGN